MVDLKKKYVSPELEKIYICLSADVLAISDPDQGVSTGSGAGQSDPSSDPFGGLNP